MIDEDKFTTEPGVVREYILRDGFAFARIRTAGDGREIWRARGHDYPYWYTFKTLDADANKYQSIDDFANSVLKGLWL